MKRSNPPDFDQDSSTEIHPQISRCSHQNDTADSTAALNGSKYITIAWLLCFVLQLGDKLCQVLKGAMQKPCTEAERHCVWHCISR